MAFFRFHLLWKFRNVRNIPADPQGLRCLAVNPAHAGERDLVRVSDFLNDTAYDPVNGFWAEAGENPDPWSYLHRYIELKKAREFVKRHLIDFDTKPKLRKGIANAWDFILAYADEVTADDIRRAVDSESPLLKLRNSPRVIELYEKLFIEHPEQVKWEDIYHASLESYYTGNYERELSLNEWLVDDFLSEADHDVLAHAGCVFRRDGNFESEVKLYDKWETTNWDASIQHSIACFAAGDFDRGIELHQVNVARFAEKIEIAEDFTDCGDSDYFRMLHIDIEKFSDRLYRMYNAKGDNGNRMDGVPLKNDEVAIYDSIFYNSSKLPDDAIDEYLDAIPSEGISYIDSVILVAGVFMHAKKGNWERVRHLASNPRLSFMAFEEWYGI